ncbi:MAG: ferrous iron transport protein A [Clostridiales bacterium]|jgi:ferrous iron transport protein A|nr:ferrous iron transport protein A [Clostridiales bacterium]
MNTTTSLQYVAEGQSVRVKQLQSTGAIRRRLQEIGLVEGTKIKCLQKSPSGDPTAYLIRGAVIALRAEDCAKIIVETN